MMGIEYTYALDSGNCIISIDNAIKGKHYCCPYCNETMIVKDGCIKTKHFAHKTRTSNCSYESYLHALAKIKIIEWFNSPSEFNISIKCKNRCEKFNVCIWQHDEYVSSNFCETETFTSFSLKRYYNEIHVEKMYGCFRPDLLLSDSNDKYNPIFIEICVKHPCERAKIKAGIRIIEISINTEKELDSIIKSHTLKEGSNISFYNFNPKFGLSETEGLRLNKFVLLESMTGFCPSPLPQCKEYTNRHPHAIFEITFDYLANRLSYINPFIFGWVVAYKHYTNIRNCFLCKYYKQNNLDRWICCLYKKLNIEKNCKSNQAIDCAAFSPDDRVINDNLKSLKKVSYNIWRKGMDNQGINYKINKDKEEDNL